MLLVSAIQQHESAISIYNVNPESQDEDSELPTSSKQGS